MLRTLKLMANITPEHTIEVPADLPVGPVELTLVYSAPVERLPNRGQGAYRGKIEIADDFDAALPDDMLDAFEGDVDDGEP